ncbi:hypothetical protein BKH41_00410 [Helicobacter sp. 12S02232-10]|uniref:DUF302 domain-containing protein n=1 Tax=Helicobacter sp. 12S02232-10 TaxID=1476197 RepID=UPI000BA68817|nr:DUF302 domain-containing protein [Helicobacter sp. 12S02232-10]PAF49802.1 hypothetical protein BKH41_00410 [Helicobacter sp. 12S02232-10]
MKKIAIIAFLLTSFAFSHQTQEVYKMKDLQVKPASIAKYDPKYLSLQVSDYDFQTTLNRAKDMIKQQKMKLFVILDHSQAATEFDQSLPPTSVIVFGNPAAGTAKMKEYPNLAIELPMKILVYERDKKVFVGFVRPSFNAKALGLPANDAFIKNTEKAYENFVEHIIH